MIWDVRGFYTAIRMKEVRFRVLGWGGSFSPTIPTASNPIATTPLLLLVLEAQKSVGFWALRTSSRSGVVAIGSEAVRWMIDILHYLKDPKLWELGSIPSYGVNADFYPLLR